MNRLKARLQSVNPKARFKNLRFDRYPSAIEELERREGPIAGATLEAWAERIFHGADTSDILDKRGEAEKRRLHVMKA